VSVPLLRGVALNKPGPGAIDNASGVATVLRLAERYGGKLEHFNLWVLFPGAGESLAAGTREFLERHEDDLEEGTTIFLNIDSVGGGTVRWATKEGLSFANAYHPSLIELCEEIAEEDSAEDGEGRFSARGYVSRSTSDAFPARTRGFPAISISCLNRLDYEPNRYSPDDTPDKVNEESLERAFGFCSQLVEQIDERIGADVTEAGEESTLAEQNE
jgi:Iap family predicted aminopeptidase